MSELSGMASSELVDSRQGVDFVRILDFYRGKRVLVTGHTGFKGSWLVKILTMAGAVVCGYSLEPPTDPSLFAIARIDELLTHQSNGSQSVIGDVRDFEYLKQVFEEFQPEIVIHMAAQPLVRLSYEMPRETYETNVMGTVNVLECVRQTPSVRSFLNVTTDKVYRNNEWVWGYREDERLDGFDPYSNSKSCSELVTHTYVRSFFQENDAQNVDGGKRPIPSISTARAGNVIGGGDFATDRIIPDCIRAVLADENIVVRNPQSIRPYQHVLEPLFGYLMIACAQYEDPSFAGSYNIGPNEVDCASTADLVDLFCTAWNNNADQSSADEMTSSQITPDLVNSSRGGVINDSIAGGSCSCCEARWSGSADPDAPHEASFLKLDSTLLKTTFGWQPRWSIARAVTLVTEWTKVWALGLNVQACMESQIRAYIS